MLPLPPPDIDPGETLWRETPEEAAERRRVRRNFWRFYAGGMLLLAALYGLLLWTFTGVPSP